jgi:hypothetical protein
MRDITALSSIFEINLTANLSLLFIFIPPDEIDLVFSHMYVASVFVYQNIRLKATFLV